MRRLGIVLPIALLVLLLGAIPAGAAFGTIADPNDAKGPLDFRTLSAIKTASNSPLKITMTFRGEFPRAIFDGFHHHLGRLTILFDVGSDGSVDQRGYLVAKPDSLRMRVVKFQVPKRVEYRFPEPQIKSLKVRHPNGHTLTLTVPNSSGWQFLNPNGPLQVAALSWYKSRFGRPCPRHYCKDRVPDSGFLGT